MEDNNLINKLENYSWILLCILMIDCSIFGAGRIITIGSISFRMIIFGLFVCFSFPTVLVNIKAIWTNTYCRLLGVLCIWIIFSCCIGIVNNNDLGIIVSDLKGLMYFTVLPGIIVILKKTERIELLTKVIMYSAFVLAIIVIVHLLLSIYMSDNIHEIATKELNCRFSMISVISYDMPRIFMFSELYLVAGCAFAVYYQIKENRTKFSLKYAIISGICLFAILVSYTRAVYLGTAVVAVFTIIVGAYCFPKRSNVLIKHIFISILIIVLFVVAFYAVTEKNYFSYAVSRSFSIELEGNNEQAQSFNNDTDSSDNIRAQTVDELMGLIKKKIVLGNGLGVGLECRNGGTSEYFFLEFWSKCGVVGLILYLLPCLIMWWNIIKNIHKKELVLLPGIWSAILLGFMCFSYFNPYMNAALGILFYCCTMGIINYYQIYLWKLSNS